MSERTKATPLPNSVVSSRDRSGEVLLEKWRLDKLLGVGGMASVYAATHRNGSRGAVKLLHPEVAADADARRRFVREGLVANTVDHPGVVKVLDDDIDERGVAFLVMELLDGESVDAFASRFAGERVTEATAMRIALDLTDILRAAHARSIVHRDIKPENLFLTRDQKLKVLDFGIARMRMGLDSARATTAGTLIGTPAFMAPEQALGHMDAIDARTDVWAIGATLFTLLTGLLVHEETSPNRVLLAAMTKPAPRLATVAPHVDARFGAIIDKALSFSQDERYAHAGEMHDALAAISSGVARLETPTMQSPPRALPARSFLDDSFHATAPSPQRSTDVTQAVASPRQAPRSFGGKLIGVGLAIGFLFAAFAWMMFRGRLGGDGASSALPATAETTAEAPPEPPRPTVQPESSVVSSPIAPSSASASARPVPHGTSVAPLRTSAPRATSTANATTPPTSAPITTPHPTTPLPDFSGRF